MAIVLTPYSIYSVSRERVTLTGLTFSAKLRPIRLIAHFKGITLRSINEYCWAQIWGLICHTRVSTVGTSGGPYKCAEKLLRASEESRVQLMDPLWTKYMGQIGVHTSWENKGAKHKLASQDVYAVHK